METGEHLLQYDKRSGVDIAKDIESLLREPEVALSPEELGELNTYAEGLFTGEVNKVTCEAETDLEKVYKQSPMTSQQEFYLGYFATQRGREDAILLHIDNREQATSILLDIDHVQGSVTAKQRKEIAIRSVEWYKALIADRLQHNPEDDQEAIDDEAITIAYDPDKILEKFDDLQKYRRFYQKVKRFNRQESEGSQLDEAKRTVLECYIRRVNGLVAELYPAIFALAHQLQMSQETDETLAWKQRLQECAPIVADLYDVEKLAQTKESMRMAVSSPSGQHRQEVVDRFAQRLDRLRNGVDVGEEGVTPISRELVGFINEDREAKHESMPEPKLTSEVIQQLDVIKFDASLQARLIETVLHEWGLYSSHTTTWEEVEDRDSYASDGLFQVVITPKKKSLSVDGAKRVVYVPETFVRTLAQASPSGALLVAAHELAHVLQNVHDDLLGEKIPLAKIKGRQALTLREGGGKYQEQRLLKEYLGRSSTPNSHYLRALERKLEGGNKLQVARAFYDSLRQSEAPSTNERDREMRELAADRSSRLYRAGGHNSQPLDYIEQELIVGQLELLDDHARHAFLLAAASFNTRDAAKLRRIGLLEIPKEVDHDPVDDVMRVFMRDFYPSYTSAA